MKNNKTQAKISKPTTLTKLEQTPTTKSKRGRPTIKKLIEEIQDKKAAEETKVLVENKETPFEIKLDPQPSEKRFVLRCPEIELPAYLVRDVGFTRDLKKSFWSEKLVFDRKPSKFSIDSDFYVNCYFTKEFDLRVFASKLILSKQKFELELMFLDQIGKVIVPRMFMKNSQLISMTLPSVSYNSSSSFTIDPMMVSLNFKCDHVVFE